MKPGLYALTESNWVGDIGTHVWVSDNDRALYVDRDGDLCDVQPSSIAYARPLVVLDPESGEDCRRLADALNDLDGAPVWLTQGAATLLRALAEPKPAEPTGLGAVVRARDGRIWVRTDVPDIAWVHTSPVADPLEFRWADLDVLEVLSEGWSE